MINHSLLAAWGVASAGALVAAIWDARTRRIPNLLTFPLLLAGFTYAGWVGGLSEIENASLGCLLLGVPYFFLFVFAGGGAGDAKMMGAIGAWVGFSGSVPVLICVSVAGAVLAIGYAILRGRLATVTANLRTMAMGATLVTFYRARVSQAQELFPEQQKMLTMPYGVSIFVGTLLAGGWVLLWH